MPIPLPSAQLLVTVASFVIFLIIIFTPQLSGLIVQFAHADFNFDAVGDWGCNSNTKNTVTNIQGKKPERVLALGDYSYTSTATCWLNTINPIKSITRINIGNHENDANEGNSQYMSAFGLSKQYYSFDYVNAHVLTMASEISFSKGSAQYNFVENDLKTAAANPNIKWIIVNYHRVMYTSPNTCSASTCEGSSSLRDAYQPLFDKYRVDLVLQGHVHNYQRTFPLKYDTVSPSSPTRTSTSTSSYTDPEGEIFVTVGTGGINFHGLSGKSYFVVSQQAAKFGILDILMTNDGTKLTGKYYRNGESTPFDTFTITKPLSISSLKFSTTNKVNFTNQTSTQIIIDQLSINQTGRNNQTAESRENITSKDRNNIQLPDLSQVINNSRKSQNNVIDANKDQKNVQLPDLSEVINKTRISENTATNADTNQENKSAVANNKDSSLPVKPVVPKDTKKNVNPIVKNNQPEANAGKNQIAVEGSQVILDGSKSKDSDGKIESYRWQQIIGPSTKVALDNPNNIEANFISPQVSHDTILVFKLTVTDDNDSSDSAITAVKVVRNEEVPAVSSPKPPSTS
ncbi:MAG: metallophosphoesterase, partial [Nitrososphaeraceae archaeon]